VESPPPVMSGGGPWRQRPGVSHRLGREGGRGAGGPARGQKRPRPL